MKARVTDRTERIGVGIAMAAFETIGFAFREQATSDYGIDAHAELIEGESPTGRLLAIQLKSGASYLSESSEASFVFRTDGDHIEYWKNHALPVLVCLCDPSTGKVFWQVVNAETSVSTGKGYRVLVPRSQMVDVDSIDRFKNLLSPIVPSERYTVFRTDDSSHNAAKRYVFKVVLNGGFTKAEIAAIVRQVTSEGRKRQYYRSDVVKRRWGKSDADVVSTFVYPSAEDCSRNNFICRSIWIRENLAPEFRPFGFDGENVGDGVIADWNEDYAAYAKFVSGKTLSKEAYFATALPILEELKSKLLTVETALLKLRSAEFDEETFRSSTSMDRDRIETIYLMLNQTGFAPFECREVDAKLECFASLLHDLVIFYAERNRTKWSADSRLDQSIARCADAREELQHLEYELKKIR